MMVEDKNYKLYLLKGNHGIKELDPGAPYTPSPQRKTRDML